jgi:mono/diheme cytochrome c family protein
MRWMMLPYIVAVAISAAALPLHATPLDGNQASGRQIATKLCSSCHHVLPMLFPDRGDSRDGGDPPSFQSIANLPSTTGLSLNVFLHSNHKNMPNLILSHADSDDLIAYIVSLKQQ